MNLKELNSKLRMIWRDYGTLLTFAGLFFGAISYIISNYVDIRSLFEPGVKVDVQEVVDSIDEGNRVLEKMLPSDAIEALVRRGYNFDVLEFYRAAYNGDIASIKLFCAAGGEGFIDPSLYYGGKVISQITAQTISECHEVYKSISCAKITDTFIDEMSDFGLQDLMQADQSHGLISMACNSSFQQVAEEKMKEKTSAFEAEERGQCDQILTQIQAIANELEEPFRRAKENGEDIETPFYMQVISVNTRFDYFIVDCLDKFDMDLNDPMKLLAQNLSIPRSAFPTRSNHPLIESLE